MAKAQVDSIDNLMNFQKLERILAKRLQQKSSKARSSKEAPLDDQLPYLPFAMSSSCLPSFQFAPPSLDLPSRTNDASCSSFFSVKRPHLLRLPLELLLLIFTFAHRPTLFALRSTSLTFYEELRRESGIGQVGGINGMSSTGQRRERAGMIENFRFTLACQIRIHCRSSRYQDNMYSYLLS
jgi:hypothetical protein